MKNLNELSDVLDTMILKQKENKARTFVARYKGKNLIVRSGKSSWKAVNHAKSALIQHFSQEENKYMYPNGYWEKGVGYETRKKREEEFRARLFELIEIIELTE